MLIILSTHKQSPKKLIKQRSDSERSNPAPKMLQGRERKQERVSMSVDDSAKAPARKNRYVAANAAHVIGGKNGGAPPSSVGEASSIVSLEERKEKRERDRADFSEREKKC